MKTSTWTRKAVAEMRKRLNLPTWNAGITPGGALQFQHRTSTHWLVLNVWPGGQKIVMREWLVPA